MICSSKNMTNDKTFVFKNIKNIEAKFLSEFIVLTLCSGPLIAVLTQTLACSFSLFICDSNKFLFHLFIIPICLSLLILTENQKIQI